MEIFQKFHREGTEYKIWEPSLEIDGFPKSFVWSVSPKKGLSWRLKIFYKIFDPVRFSLWMGRLVCSSFSRFLIVPFVFFMGIDRKRFESKTGNDFYKNFDEFFTRRFKKMPPFYSGAAPAEGQVIYLARGKSDQMLSIKGEKVSLKDLLGKAFSYFPAEVGVVITYLSPKDYHLGHSPFAGKVVFHERIPGSAWTVAPEIWNEKDLEGFSGVHYLTLNARDVLVKETLQGPFATVYVAATNVFSTEMHVQVGEEVAVGQHEQSYHLGSTNVYVFDAKQFCFPSHLFPGEQLVFGQTPFLIPKSENL